jgi:hypothetical protein
MALPQQVPAHANATESEVNIMSKGMDSKKQVKKKPLKTASEKRTDKKDKQGAKTLLGSHAANA